jgi:hypothetical protein
MGLSCDWARNASGGGAPPTVCLLVVNDPFLYCLRVGGDNWRSSCSLENLEVYWDTLGWRHLLRNLQVDLFPWHKSVLVSNPSKFEQASELVRKVVTPSRCHLHWYVLKAESTLMAWFWIVFILLFTQWRSSTWIFRLQVTITGWSLKVRLGFGTCMLHVNLLVGRLANVGMLREYHQC